MNWIRNRGLLDSVVVYERTYRDCKKTHSQSGQDPGHSPVVSHWLSWFWMVENYQNDFYFQTYVNSSLQGSGFTIVALSCVGIFSAVAMGLYMKLRRTHRELEHLILTEHAPPEEQGASTILQPHVEQHLIEMIRKSTPSEASGVSSSMPILKRDESQSSK